MLLHLHSPEVGKSEKKNTQRLELGKRSEGAEQTPKDERARAEQTKTERGEGAYLLSAKSPGTGSSPGRGLHEKREGSSVERWGGTAGCSSGGDAGRDGEVGAEAQGEDLLPAQKPSPPPASPPPPPLPSESCTGGKPGSTGLFPAPSGAPHPGPAWPGGCCGWRGSVRGLWAGALPAQIPQNPSHPPPCGAATHLREGERHLLVQVPLHPAARALPPRSCLLSAGTWRGGRGTAGVKLTTSRASRTCRGQPTPCGGNPIPGGGLLTAPQTWINGRERGRLAGMSPPPERDEPPGRASPGGGSGGSRPMRSPGQPRPPAQAAVSPGPGSHWRIAARPARLPAPLFHWLPEWSPAPGTPANRSSRWASARGEWAWLYPPRPISARRSGVHSRTERPFIKKLPKFIHERLRRSSSCAWQRAQPALWLPPSGAHDRACQFSPTQQSFWNSLEVVSLQTLFCSGISSSFDKIWKNLTHLSGVKITKAWANKNSLTCKC